MDLLDQTDSYLKILNSFRILVPSYHRQRKMSVSRS